jgi:hypothetical protein
MYTDINFKTKKALKEAVAAGNKVRVFQPGDIFTLHPTEGEYSVEGPHFPEPHRWYARVTLLDGVITKVK